MVDALAVRQIHAGYGETVVLEDIELSLPENGSLAVLGRNGVGKTTLLSTIMGHTTMHAGEILFRGARIDRMPVYDRARLGVGYVPQERWIFPSLSVQENLTVAHRTGRWNVDRVFDLFPRLHDRRKAMGNQLSGGEQQMLAMGRALMGNPSLLLLDEPLEGLAPIVIEGLLRSIQRLIVEDALAIVLVEQHAKVALGITQNAIVLSRGRIIHSGPSRHLLENPEYLAKLVVTQ